MKIVVVDGQGGRLGRLLVEEVKARLPQAQVYALGTNTVATAAMLKAGAAQGATGENAVVYNAARADVILGPIGMVLANGILGEVSPAMASAVSGAGAVKILIPSSSCGVYVAGVEEFLALWPEGAVRRLEGASVELDGQARGVLVPRFCEEG